MVQNDVPEDESTAQTTAPTVEEALVKRRLVDVFKHPNQRYVDNLTLQRSSRRSVDATHLEIIDQRTQKVHHHAIKIEVTPSVSKSEGGGWRIKPGASIWISDENDDAIGKLRDFLSVVRGDLPEEAGDYLVAQIENGEITADTLQRFITAASTSGKVEALIQAVEAISCDPAALESLAQLALAHPDASQVAAAALSLARYTDVLAELERLIEANAAEQEFQSLLANNPWIFGSEYSELHPRRVWVRDQQKDFMLRRAVDGYLEIIEIKTPLGISEKLFLPDNAHDCLYPRNQLTKVVAQVMYYLEEVDAARDSIYRRDNERVTKITARIIIGRDHDDEQVEMLRRFNSHQDRMEVLTFDQLLRIGRRVVHQLQHVINPLQDDEREKA